MRIETTVAKGYGKNFGGKIAYLRELMANGIDGEKRNLHNGRGAFDANWSRNGTITLTNWGVRVSTSALLMGTSESQADEACIGQFGEGLVMALKGLCELGHAVEIFNRDEKWRPAIEPSRSFEGAEVLVVHTRKCTDRGGFIVKVKGLDPEDWAKLQGLFLSRHPAYDKTQTATDYNGKERVLLQPEFQGKVYNKGVFLLERDDLLFGYDLANEENINRDRSVMSDYALTAQIMDVLDNAVCYDEAFQDRLVNVLFSGQEELELKDTYSSLRDRSALCTKASKVFYDRYGQSAHPVRSEAEIEEANKLGLRGVVVPPTLWGMLTSGGNFESISDMKDSAEREVQEADPYMTSRLKSNLELAKFLLGKVGWVTPLIHVVVFGGDEVKVRNEGEEILLAKNVADDGLSAILQTLLTVRTYDDEPNSREILSRSNNTLASIIEQQWE